MANLGCARAWAPPGRWVLLYGPILPGIRARECTEDPAVGGPRNLAAVRAYFELNIHVMDPLRNLAEAIMLYRLEGSADGRHLVFLLHDGTNKLGRSQCADIVLPYSGVSRHHAEIVIHGNGAEIHDSGARNGVAVNGRRITTRHLQSGDNIALGEIALTFLSGDSAHATNRAAHLIDSDGWRTGPGITSTVDRGFPPRLFEALVQFGDFLVGDDDIDAACRSCLERVSHLFDFRKACLFVVDEVGMPELRCCYSRRTGAETHAISRSVVDHVIASHESVLVPALPDHGVHESARLAGIRSLLAVPLILDADVIGALYMDQDDPQRAFKPRHQERLQLLGNLVAAKLARAQVGTEMQTAAAIARRFLSTVQAPSGFDVAARLEPCAKVGGDLYETLPLPGGRYLCAVGDVSGKGITAALVMAETLATLRALAVTVPTPLQLVLRLRELLSEKLVNNMFVTLFLAIVDPLSGRVDYVSAGHEPAAMLAPGAALRWLDSTGPPIGWDLPVPLAEASIVLPPGALLAAWSDGITEALRPGSNPPRLFGREGVQDWLETHPHAAVAAVVDGVFAAVDRFLGRGHAPDDRTMLVLRRHITA